MLSAYSPYLLSLSRTASSSRPNFPSLLSVAAVSAVSTDSAAEAGAPAGKIEITPAMIRAGAELIWRYFYDAMVYGDESALELAKAVFLAMTHQSFLDEARPKQKSS
jgi:hypothetical protein